MGARRDTRRGNRGQTRRGAWAAAVLLLPLIALLAPAAAHATVLEKMSVEQLAQRAALVVEGTVLSTSVDRTGGEVRTDVRLQVRETLKGEPGDVAEFSVPGGTLPDGTVVRVDAMPTFQAGDECYVFVDVRGWVIAGFQGKISVVAGTRWTSSMKRAVISARIKKALRPGDAAAEGAAAPAPSGARASSSPVISSVSPSSASAGTWSLVTISGSGFGSQEGWVEFTYGNDNVARIGADIHEWSATEIQCYVPTAVINDEDASAGSGPMWVTSADGSESAPYSFSVPFGFGSEHWMDPHVTYYINTTGIDNALRESLVDAGIAKWNAVGTAFQFIDGGSTTATIATDGKNVISWAWGLPDGVIAQSGNLSLNGLMKEADISFSNAYVWGDGAPGSGTMDIQSIATHETGYWLVLLDLYGPGDTDKVMYGYGEEESVTRTLSAGDLAGIKWIYPVDTTPPQVKVKNVTAKRGQTVKINFLVYDDTSGEVAWQVDIVTRSGAVKKTWSSDGFDENYDGWGWVAYRLTLPKGTYGIVVKGMDMAGNEDKAIGTLKVK